MDAGTRVNINVPDEPSFQGRTGTVVPRPAWVTQDHEDCDLSHVYVDVDGTPAAAACRAVMFHESDLTPQNA